MMMNTNFTLPQRPLHVRRGVLSMPFVLYFSAPVLFMIMAFIVVSEGPGILRDFKISQAPILVDGSIDGSCKTRKAVFTTCEAKLSYQYGGVRHATDAELMFVDIHSGDYETDIVISKNDPALATLSLGIDMLWNRIVTFAFFVLLLGAGGIVILFNAFRVLQSRKQFRKPGLLKVIPVTITAQATKRGRVNLTYVDNIRDGKTKRTAYSQFKNGEVPLVTGEGKNGDAALAVWHEAGSLPVLLDDRLERIDLTEEERASLLHTLRPSVTESEGVDRPAPVKTQSPMQRLKVFASVVLLIVVGFFGYWFWYVLGSPTQFNSPGMDINNMMPEALNRWGCSQLQKRFGNENAPFGCAAGDYVSWK